MAPTTDVAPATAAMGAPSALVGSPATAGRISGGGSALIALREVGYTAGNPRRGQSTVELMISRNQGLAHLAGVAASSVAECCGFTPAQAKDIEVAVCEACTGLAGRFFVGACHTIIILIAVHPRRLRVTVCGDGPRRSPELAEMPLDPHDTDMSLGVLRALMDSVAVLLHGQRGFCVVMSKRRLPMG